MIKKFIHIPELDINTQQGWEALENFAGCAVVICHNRWFLDRICTYILAFEGDSQTRLFLGNWSDYEADYKERYGKSAEVPQRIKDRKLKR